MMKFKMKISAACLALTLLLNGCGAAPAESVQSAESAVQGETVSGTIGIRRAVENLQFYEYPDFYAEGYTARLVEYEDPAQPLRELLRGELDCCAAPLSAVIEARSAGQPVTILCNVTGKGIAVVTGVRSEIERMLDLTGKRVGFTAGDTGDTLLLLALWDAGIDPDEIEWAPLLPEEMNDALKAGEIDAYCGEAISAGEAVLEGFGRVLSYPYREDTLGTANLVLVTTEEVIAQKRDWLQQMVDTHRQAAGACGENEALWLGRAEELGLNRAAAELERDNIELLWDVEEEFVICTRNLAAQMLDAGLISELPNMATLFDHSFLEKTKEHFLS